MQHFKLVNWWFRFLMSRTDYTLSIYVNIGFSLIGLLRRLFKGGSSEDTGVNQGGEYQKRFWQSVSA